MQRFEYCQTDLVAVKWVVVGNSGFAGADANIVRK